MYLFHPPGLLPKDIYSPDNPRRIVDVAYFYDRGNNLYGPWGANPGNIFATATSIDDMENFAKACLDVWKNGFLGELPQESILPHIKTCLGKILHVINRGCRSKDIAWVCTPRSV